MCRFLTQNYSKKLSLRCVIPKYVCICLRISFEMCNTYIVLIYHYYFLILHKLLVMFNHDILRVTM